MIVKDVYVLLLDMFMFLFQLIMMFMYHFRYVWHCVSYDDIINMGS